MNYQKEDERMSKSQPYKLMIKTYTSSKAKFLKVIPMKSFVEGEKYEIYFRLENIGEEVFPGGDLHFRIAWPSQQFDEKIFPIPPLKVKETYDTPKFLGDALSDGYALVHIFKMLNVKDKQSRSHLVEFYSGKRIEDRILLKESISSLKAKTWEESYEFWALIVATLSLGIIALEKVYPFLLYFLRWVTGR